METGDKNRDDFRCMQVSLVMSMWFIFGDDSLSPKILKVLLVTPVSKFPSFKQFVFFLCMLVL